MPRVSKQKIKFEGLAEKIKSHPTSLPDPLFEELDKCIDWIKSAVKSQGITYVRSVIKEEGVSIGDAKLREYLKQKGIEVPTRKKRSSKDKQPSQQ